LGYRRKLGGFAMRKGVAALANLVLAACACLSLRVASGDACREDLLRLPGEDGGCGDCVEGYYADGQATDSRCKFFLPKFVRVDAVSDEWFLAPVKDDFGDELTVTPVDIDGDGDDDFFVVNEDGEIFYLENSGSQEEPVFTGGVLGGSGGGNPLDFVVIGNNGPGAKSFARVAFADLDGDGDFDAFITGEFTEIRMYENVGDAGNPSFVLAYADKNPFVKAPINPLWKRYSLAFGDVNNDSLVDVCIGWDDQVELFLNRGNSTHPNFPVSDGPVTNFGFNILRNIQLVDFDNDGYLDAFLAVNVVVEEILYLRNDFKTGEGFNLLPGSVNPFEFFDNIARPIFREPYIAITSLGSRTGCVMGTKSNGLVFYELTAIGPFPSSFTEAVNTNPFESIDVGDESSPFFADLNGDGYIDLVIGAEHGRIFFFENIGFSNGRPIFEERTGSENPFNSFDFLEDVTISLYPFTSENLYDGIVGSQAGEVHLLRNIGNVTNPEFELVPDGSNPFRNISIVGLYTFTNEDVEQDTRPIMYDWNNDGFVDIITGSLSGQIYFFQGPNFDNDPLMDNPFNEVAFTDSDGNRLTKVMNVDLDGDGLMDFFTNDVSGSVRIFRNVGNRSHPSFSQDPFSNPFENINVGTKLIMSNFVDLDNDFDLDVLIGADDGRLYYFENVGSDCATSCIGRGICIQGQSCASISELRLLTEVDLGLEITAGTCVCLSERFQGQACEQCTPRFYGQRCGNECPRFSRTQLPRGEKVYPYTSTLDDCVCDETFVRLDINGTFECACPPGFGFSPELEGCVRCPLGFFSGDHSTLPCIPCNDFRPQSTTVIDGANTSEACLCRDLFVEVGGACSCEFPFIYSSRLRSCICDAGYTFDEFEEKCLAAPLGPLERRFISGVAGAAVGSFMLVFSLWNRRRLFFRSMRLPWGCDHYFFVSYRQSTGTTAATKITALLRKAGFSVWIDQDFVSEVSTPSMIRGVKLSAAFILVLTDGSLESASVRKELSAAVQHDKPIFLVHTPGFDFSLEHGPTPGARAALDVLFQGQESIEIPEGDSSSQRMLKRSESFKKSKNHFVAYLEEKYKERWRFTMSAISKSLLRATKTIQNEDTDDSLRSISFMRQESQSFNI